MTQSDVFSTDLVSELLIKSKLVLGFSVRYFVHLEPIHRGLQITWFQSLDVTDV